MRKYTSKTLEWERNGRVATRWTQEKCAWFGFLVGTGKSAVECASDPIIKSNANNINRRAQVLGLSFKAAKRQLRVPTFLKKKLQEEAEKREILWEELAVKVLTILVEDPILLDNVLDDMEE